jgi:ribose transport system substrate-binding protein
MKWTLRLAGLACASLMLSSVSAWAGPKIVSGPGANPGCFKPWSD